MIDDSEAFLALPPALRDALPGHPWHVAPYTAMADILKEGIRPDAAPVWSSGRCRSWGGISLFDFRGDLAIIARQFDVWQPWVRGAQGGRRCKVWLRLDPGKLTGEPLLPQRVWDDHKRAGAAGDDRYNPIPKVEACHIGVIDVEAIIDAILIYAWDCTQFRRPNSCRFARRSFATRRIRSHQRKGLL